jgi:hypothetical protein
MCLFDVTLCMHTVFMAQYTANSITLVNCECEDSAQARPAIGGWPLSVCHP